MVDLCTAAHIFLSVSAVSQCPSQCRRSCMMIANRFLVQSRAISGGVHFFLIVLMLVVGGLLFSLQMVVSSDREVVVVV